jgi:hypothetical protein
MKEEPVEVEVLDKDQAPMLPSKRPSGPLAPVINTLAFVFAVLTALMILLVSMAAVLVKQNPPPDQE